MNSVPIYILAGGRSRRFGSDKARATLAGQPLIRRIADGLAPVAASITVVADVEGKYSDLGLCTISDQAAGLGPIGGLATALADLEVRSQRDWLLLVSCDLVEVRPMWVRRLSRGIMGGARAVAFKGECWEPLFGLYHRDLKQVVSRHIRTRTLAMQRLLDAAASAAVDLPDDWPSLSQINTRDDYDTARKHWSSSES